MSQSIKDYKYLKNIPDEKNAINVFKLDANTLQVFLLCNTLYRIEIQFYFIGVLKV